MTRSKSMDCPHCGQDLRLSPDAKDEIEAAFEKGYLAAFEGPEVKILVEALEKVHSLEFADDGYFPVNGAMLAIENALSQYREAVKP